MYNHSPSDQANHDHREDMRKGGGHHLTTGAVLHSWRWTKRRPNLGLVGPLLLFFLLFFYFAFSGTTSSFSLFLSYQLLQPDLTAGTPPASTPLQRAQPAILVRPEMGKTAEELKKARKKEQIDRARVAICLVGGARRFELTGPSIVKNLLEEYPNADLFLHSPLDDNSYKLSLLKSARRIAAVRIFAPQTIEETDLYKRMLTPSASPNGIQGLLQYFNLVEGCLRLIESEERRGSFTYDWIIRTRVDGYWSGRLDPDNFLPAVYVVPDACQGGGLNDRFGVGDRLTSTAALSRLSLIPRFNATRWRGLNSEAAFLAQLVTLNVTWKQVPVQFCVVSDRRYPFPPSRGVPVLFMGVKWPLGGTKCRPCEPPSSMGPRRNGSLEERWKGIPPLCDASGGWEEGWESVFDQVAGVEAASERRRVAELEVARCVADFEAMKKKAASWEAPPAEEICNMGLGRTKSTL